MKKWFIQKTLSLMKICALQAFIATFFCCITAAHNNYAQLLDKEITVNVKNLPFVKVLNEIETVAKVKFVYSTNQLNVSQQITLQITNRPLRFVLHELLDPLRITFKVHESESSITLRKNAGEGVEKTPPDHTSNSNGHESTNLARLVEGTVFEATSLQPMAGVNIIIKGTLAGTTTNAEGKYAIEATQDDILIFSFIGYHSYETKVGGQSVIDVVLQEDIQNLKEVIINAGYYTTTKATQTGNITKIDANEISKQPVSNPLAALQGRVPGLEIIQQTGVPGGNFQVRIRGVNSLANGNDPLYIINGVPFTSASLALPETSGSISGPGGFSPFNSIDPANIESIEILKDADATAIYGSRGSNGVILITTKKGQPGKTKVDFNFYSGVAQVATKLKLLNSRQYVEMRKEAFANDGVAPTVGNARDILVWDTTRYTDWQKVLIGGTAQMVDAQFSISGGNEQTQFHLGSGYHKETTVFPGNNTDQRISIQASINNTSVNKKLVTTFSFNYTVNLTNLLRQDLTNKAILLPPVAPPLYDQSGNLNWTNWSSTYENPLAYTKREYEARVHNLFGNAVVSYALLPNLKVLSSIGYTNLSNKAITLSPISSQFPDPAAQNSTAFSNSTFQNWIVEPQIRWNPAIGENQFDFLLGTTFLNQTSDGLAQTGFGFSSEALMKNLSSAPNRTTGTNYYSQYRYHAVFGRVNYKLKDRYIINFTARRDGSSRFGPGKQFATFAAVGAAWLFSQESFINNLFAPLSFGKLRISYGTTGNDQLGDYQYLDTYSSSTGTYLNTIGLQPNRLSNPDFAWETNKKLEAGLELGFLKNRVMTTLSGYLNKSSNQLVGFPLPATTGFVLVQGNFPATVRNSGIEFELSTINIETAAVKWSTSFNLSIPRNKLTEFPNLSSFPAYANLYEVGEPLSIRKLFKYTGIDETTGLYTFQDVNEDGIYNFEDRQTIRSINRNFFGGIHNSISYKGFQLDVLFQFVKQTGHSYHLMFAAPGLLLNQPAEVMNRWRPDDNSTIQRFGQASAPATAHSQFIASNRAVTDASFIRLKNLSLSYTLPLSWIQKVSITNARLFVQGQNLLTITKYKGLDPETQSGVQLPPLRVITAGVHLTF
jgi:TonB-linked SusC/RagA family outer membrane protein